MAEHRLDAGPTTVTDVFDRDAPPVLTVDPGDRLVVRTLDASGYLARQHSPGDRPPQLLPEARGHCLTGPVEVRGALPGTVLAVTLEDLQPDDWGWTVAGFKNDALAARLGVAGGPRAELLWAVDVETGTATSDAGLQVPLAPFLGVLGMPPDEPGQHATTPPRTRGGGNMDCRELVAGSTLYLPVTVPGARLCLGDGHAAQGDGEVGGTAVECAMTTRLVLDVVPQGAVPGVHAVTPAGRITFGFDADLNAATGDALDAMLTWLQELHGLDRTTALAHASAAVDLRVTQVANQTWGVHAVLPHEVLVG